MGFFDWIGENIIEPVVSGITRPFTAPGREAAAAQGRIAEAQLAQAQSEREQALGYAGESPGEMAARLQLLELQQQVLGRTNRELEFLQSGLNMRSPGAAEAGQGLFSSIIMRQRQAQRSQLESTLRRRFGSGYATTSAGQAALQQFDQGTADVAVQAIPQFLQTAYGSIQASASLEDLVKRRQIGALTGTPIIPYTGASEVGGLQSNLVQQQMLGSILQTGATLGAAYLGGPMAGMAANQATKGLTQAPGAGAPVYMSPQSQSGWQQGYGFGNYGAQLGAQGNAMFGDMITNPDIGF